MKRIGEADRRHNVPSRCAHCAHSTDFSLVVTLIIYGLETMQNLFFIL